MRSHAAQVSTLPAWFRSLMYVEVFAQLPLFVAGAYAFAARKEWIRMPGLIYSISTAATMVSSPLVPSRLYGPQLQRQALIADNRMPVRSSMKASIQHFNTLELI